MSNVDAEQGGLLIQSEEDVKAALLGSVRSWSLTTEDYALIERLTRLRALLFDSNMSALAAELYTEDGEHPSYWLFSSVCVSQCHAAPLIDRLPPRVCSYPRADGGPRSHPQGLRVPGSGSGLWEVSAAVAAPRVKSRCETGGGLSRSGCRCLLPAQFSEPGL